MPGFGRQQGRRSTDTPTRIENVLSERVLADPMVDRDELNDLLRDPSPLRADEPDDNDTSAYDEIRAEPESPAVRLAKLAGLVLAVALLCGSLVAAVFLDRYSVAAREAPPERQITGLAALAGLAMATPTGTATGHAVVPPSAVAATRQAEPNARTAPTPVAQVSDHAAVGQVAREFYERFAAAPDAAIAMLGGSLLGNQPDEVTEALRRIDAVTVHQLSVQPNGMVRAVITVTREDSQRYRLTQLLRVEAGPPALITEARLLSAQHSPGGE